MVYITRKQVCKKICFQEYISYFTKLDLQICCNYDLKYCRQNNLRRDRLQPDKSLNPNLVNLIQKVGNATIGFEIVQNSSISTLQDADVLIKDYKDLIANHTANNMNRNTTFETEEEFLDNKTRIVSDISTKLEYYLTTSK